VSRPAPTYRLMEEPCDECLATPQRIVEPARAKQLMQECLKNDVKFICHKTADVACRGVHDALGPCRAKRFADHFGIATVLVDPVTLEERP
jgi:hypothetical protein